MSTEDAELEKHTHLRCLDYMTEYRHCICKLVAFIMVLEFNAPLAFLAAFHQFHQYYIHGKFSSCKEPKERIKNCIKWKTFRSEEAKKLLLTSLAEEQKDMHTCSPVWTYRSSPPSDW